MQQSQTSEGKKEINGIDNGASWQWLYIDEAIGSGLESRVTGHSDEK